MAFVALMTPPVRGGADRRNATMKLTTMTQVTVDGVMQGNGGN